MVRFLISLLLVAAALPRSVWADMSGGAIPASYYVQDGLIAHWDGIENAGVGKHDLGASAWKDLVGSRDLRLNANCGYFRHNSLYCACTASGYAAGGADACTDYLTIELRCDPNPKPIPNSSYDSAYIFCAGDTSNYRMFAQSTTGFLVRSGSSYYNRPSEAATCSATYSGTSANAYYTNGAPSKALSASTWSNRGNKIAVGNGYNTAMTYPYSGNVYTIRLYSRALTQEELAHNAMLDYARFTAPHDTRYLGDATSGTLECRVVFESSDTARGTVSCTVAGVAKSGGEVWAELDETVVLKPTAKSGYKWVKWTGDLDGVAVASDGTATFAGRAKRLTSWFLPIATMASPRTWTGNGGNPYWDTPGNWDPNGVPGTDDFVLIDKPSAKVVVRTSTADLSSLTLGGTAAGVASIVCTNWMTQIKAQEMVVRNYGELTSGAMPLNTDMSNRVWLVCRDLDIQDGGKINVDNLGYTNNNGPAWNGLSGTITASSGGSHGGLSSLGEGANRSHCYDSLTEPESPGSGGYRQSSGLGALGGGAVKIEASRNVRIDGAVTARGQACAWNSRGGGSGGSVYISAQTVCGSGEVDVGTVDNFNSNSSGYSNGGGGRLAVHYDPVLQTAKDPECLIKFSARAGAGSFAVHSPYSGIEATTANGYFRPKEWVGNQGESGTMWFTDYRLLTNEVRQANGVLLSGRFFSGVPLPDRLRMGARTVFNNSFLELQDAVEAIEVDGDVTMSGTYYVTSGFRFTNSTWKVHGDVVMSGAQIKQVGGATEIDGNLTMTNSVSDAINYSSRLDIQAVDVSTNAEFGALFSMKGTWFMSQFSMVYPRAEKTTGFVPFFDCLNLDMRPNSCFDAQLTGYGVGNGPGYGKGSTGSSHGGRGGSTTGNRSKIPETYGELKRPVTAGSGSNATHPGGGAICVRARNRMDLNGYVVAHGNGWTVGNAFGSSGGSVYLSAARFSSTNGFISVRGGKSVNTTYCGGGGGRVAICARALLATNVVIRYEGGVPVANEQVPAEAGTLYWFDNPGSMFLIR